MNRGNQICQLSELQAAVLLPQLDKLDARNAHRAAMVRLLVERLADIPGLQPLTNTSGDSQAGYYKLGFQYDSARFGMTRELFVRAARAEGIAMDEGFRALHVGRSPNRFRQSGSLTQATRAHEGMLVLHHPVLLGTSDDIDQVAVAVHRIHAKRTTIRLI
jgi:dTDP-4-amino-4,6-dideoxygalactose transaminase